MLDRLEEHIFKPLTEHQIICAENLRHKAHFDKCPICARGPDTAKRVNLMLAKTYSPEEIRKQLKKIGRSIPKADSPQLFSHAIDHHIYLCLHENYKIYHQKLSERRREQAENAKLHQELSEASDRFCLESKLLEDNIDFDLDIAGTDSDIIDVVTNQLGSPNNMGNPRIQLDKDDLKLDLRGAIPNLITNQIRIMEIQQQRYLNGEITTPPDIKALESILKNLKTLIGSSELTDIIDS